MLQQVISLINNNRLMEAKNICNQLFKSNKKNADLLMLMADINSRLGAIKEAKLNYKKVIKLRPAHSQAYTGLAMLYHGQEIYPKAEKYYRCSLKINNKQPVTHYNLGAVLQELGKLENAESEYRQAIEFKPDYVKAHANLGYILKVSGKLDESVAHYQQALQQEPDTAELHYNLGLTLLLLGDTANAKKHQLLAIKSNSDYADAWYGLASVHSFTGDFSQACDNYQKSLELNPDNIDALIAYAGTLSDSGNHEAALQQIELVLKKEPDNLTAIAQQAIIYGALGQANKALEYCDKIFDKSPNNENAAIVAANMHEILGDAQRAFTYIEPLLKNDPPDVSVALCYLAISEKTGCTDDAVKYLESTLQLKNNCKSDVSKIHFALGKAFDKSGEYDKAFNYYETGNNFLKSDFNNDDFCQYIDNTIKVFDKDYKKHLATSLERSSRPIFIVGMPRSGTSLVEQIISSHSSVFGAGEQRKISTILEELPAILNSNKQPIDCLSIADEKIMTQLSQSYLDFLTDLNADASYVTDKMPGNYMNLGLIQLLFPNSKIIYCKRNPLDNCLSCYFQYFSRDINWSYEQKHLGCVYNEHLRLMEHWKNILELPILEVQYETLTSNQEKITRDILNFLDIEWEDQCLDFHKNKRLVWTASYNQVRNPMYNKSVERWKHYEEHLGPLIEIIQNP